MTVKMWERAQRMQEDQATLSEYCYPGYWDDRAAWCEGDSAGDSFKWGELEEAYARLSKSSYEKIRAYHQGQIAGTMFRRKEWQTATAAEKELWK